MGNICRSPTAEGFFRHYLEASGGTGRIHTDSAGTHAYHTGNPPDERAIHCAAEYGVDIARLRARTIQARDFKDFDLVIAMDLQNLAGLQRMAPPDSTAQLELMMRFATRSRDIEEVPDPYYGALSDFRRMCELLDDASQGLLHYLQESSLPAPAS